MAMKNLIEVIGDCARVEVVFTPEHGLWGAAAAGEFVRSGFEAEFGVRVYSLYGEELEPPVEELQKLDLVVYDIQDLGLRWYTYASTLYYVEKACAKAGVPLLVLDRPNPLTGMVTEGPVLKPEYRSFVGVASIPARYALTPGELALYYSRVEGLNCEVQVIELEGWRRSMWFDETGLPWIPTSPNIPNLETALVYAGACMLEGTNLSEGRGTASPFLQFGAPWVKARELARALNEEGIPGVAFRPVKFVPTASKYSGQLVSGVYVHLVDRSRFKPFTAFVKILRRIREMYGEFELLTREAEREVEYVKDYTAWSTGASRYVIDYLAGTSEVRECIEGRADVEEAEERWRVERSRYLEKAAEKGVMLYEPRSLPLG
jgi:uncharacterized protein YbbC (DUF1343 family)